MLVILSEVRPSRTQSKDPVDLAIGTNLAGHLFRDSLLYSLRTLRNLQRPLQHHIPPGPQILGTILHRRIRRDAHSFKL